MSGPIAATAAFWHVLETEDSAGVKYAHRTLCPRLGEELAAWVHRDEEYATLGAEVVVELNSESRTRRPTTRAWAIIRRGQRAHQRASERQQRGERRQADRASRTGRSPSQLAEREVTAEAR